MWDPPSQAIGAPEPPKAYMPLWDLSYPPEDRRPKFAIWVSSYFKHPPNPTHDPNALLYLQSESDASRKPTIAGLTPEEVASMLEVTAGDHSETKMLERDWLGATLRQMMKAVFSSEVRRAWASTTSGGVGFYLLYGDESVWNVVYAAWYIEDLAPYVGGS
ncbi:hypothetical protein D9613_003852 [Agrocybe pediades]|uniref:Uncharacterized protein n=1 Tax=Agrocybe pediades TaxID=84607 RepID=A0A8H4QIV7_9AGAR|nr:hypothetical protein D9613_003852 [Agrocybe pediades]